MKKFEELREEAFGRARFNQQLKKKGIDTDKMHSTNVKDATAAKQRSKDAAKDHADFKKKNPSVKFDESGLDYNPAKGGYNDDGKVGKRVGTREAKEIEEISVGMQQRYKKKAMKQYKDSGRKKEVGGVGMTTKQSTADKHMDRFVKRHKGIGSVIKRDGGSDRTDRNPGANSMTKNKAPYRNESVNEAFGKVHPTLKKELGSHGAHAIGMASSDKGVAVQFNTPKNTSDLMKQMSKHGYKGVTAVGNEKNTYHFNEEADKFVPHMMYNPKTGKGYKAETEKDHLQMKRLGYSHEAPKDVKEAKGEDGKGHYRATDDGAGMTQKGVDAVNRKTGGNLQTAVTGKAPAGSKDAGRRKSFCARMGGMKGPMKDDDGKPTRKAQSLKRWKC